MINYEVKKHWFTVTGSINVWRTISTGCWIFPTKHDAEEALSMLQNRNPEEVYTIIETEY